VKSITGDVNAEIGDLMALYIILPNLSYRYIVDLSVPIDNRWAFSSLTFNGLSLSRALFFMKKLPLTNCRFMLTCVTDYTFWILSRIHNAYGL